MRHERTYDQEFHNDLAALLEARHLQLLRGLLAQLHPADLADVLEHIGDEDRHTIFGLLAEPERSQAVAEMEEGARGRLLQDLEPSQIADLVEVLESDDAADLLQDLEEEEVERVLTEVPPEDSRRVRRLLAYPEDTAGGIMAAEVVAVPEIETVDQAIGRLRQAGEAQEDIPCLFVVDAQGRLTGTLSLRDMLLNEPTRQVAEIADREVRSVPAAMDQEEVAELVRKYDLAVVPVVDRHQRLIGQITLDDILEVYEEEASEDFVRLSGGLQEESPADSVFAVSRNRLPWLLLGLAGGALSAWVMSRFSGTFELREALQISFFIPVIMAMGGNVGIQSSATVVRGLATGEIDVPGSRNRLIKEILVGALNALVLAGVLWLIVTLWLGRIRLGVVVGISLAVAMTFAAVVGSAIPLIFKRLGTDPALATGPFVTTTNDLVGLTIYLAMTTLLLNWI